MKKLDIIIRPEKVEKMKWILQECDAKGAMFTRVSGYGNQRGKEYTYQGKTYFENIFTKTKVETYVDDETADKLIDMIKKEIPDGEVGDGKIFVTEISNVIRLRTGEEGEKAL
ncbi:MAG: P-II family nitrogen regulator [Lachnospiraceae bacterium]|jgi:nitrogen regulatory protein P-II 1|nr:P-II family nitrogen regulator [Lachnospiraceae bacterium]